MDDTKIKLGASATALVVASLAIGVAIGRPADAPATSTTDRIAAANATPAPTCENFKPDDYAKVARPVLDADKALRDLGGQCVDPGATVTTGANFDRGTRLVSAETWLDGDKEHAFKLGEQYSCEDSEQGTWCEVTATNTSTKPKRLFVLVRVTVDAPEAEAPDAGDAEMDGGL
jgi:hypothetical protein